MILFFDLETTGTNVAKDRIVQMAFKQFNYDDAPDDTERVLPCSQLETLVFPEMYIPEEATAVHGITNEMVVGLQPFSTWAPRVLELLNSSTHIVGYNIQNYDIPLLAEELARCGFDWPEHLVTVDLYRSWAKRETRTLADAVKRFGAILDIDALHDAGADVDATIGVINGMFEEYDVAFEDLAKDSDNGPACDPARYFRKTDDGVVVFAFGKHKDLPAESQRGYLRWMLGSDFPMTTKKFIAQKLGVV
ncbi:MAG: 3'-5' exonuclease [Bacteroidetes bacterium]|nr:3'-5' exonuclease [Bacteroidota bacterium]